jgi:hypothetical protein
MEPNQASTIDYTKWDNLSDDSDREEGSQSSPSEPTRAELYGRLTRFKAQADEAFREGEGGRMVDKYTEVSWSCPAASTGVLDHRGARPVVLICCAADGPEQAIRLYSAALQDLDDYLGDGTLDDDQRWGIILKEHSTLHGGTAPHSAIPSVSDDLIAGPGRYRAC